MPILEIDVVRGPGPARAAGLAQRLADAAGVVFASPPASTWVKLRMLDPEDYAENGAAASTPAPAFVKILKRAIPEGPAMAEEVRRLTTAVATVLERSPENIHICYEPPAAGRQALGGAIV